jgi:hypothetical protein
MILLPLLLHLFLSATSLRGQVPHPGPDSVAAEFQASLLGVGWRAAASRLHPEALEEFHYLMTLMVEMDTTGGPIDKLYPQGGLPEFYARSHEEVFLRVMEVLTLDAEGLVHALVVRDVEILGHVSEGAELAHVVYRSTARLSGADPELRILTMKRSGDRWRVRGSQEVDVLVEAFRGITRKVRPPPGGWPGGVPPDTAGTSGQGKSRWQSVHVSPWRALIPSIPIMGTMANAAMGSAHHHPRSAFRARPTRRMAER